MGHQKALTSKNVDVQAKRVPTPVLNRSPSRYPPSHPLQRLQRHLGNRAVTQLIQTKLKVGPVGDRYEQEADHTANTVMRMAEPTVARQAAPEEEKAQAKPLSVTPLIQRQTDEKKDDTAQMMQRQTEEKKDDTAQMMQRQTEEKKDDTAQMMQRQTEEKKDDTAQMMQRQTEEKKDDTAQRQGETVSTPEVTSNVENRIQAMRGGGQTLGEGTRSFFEPRFGYDFSGVRVHTDGQAGEIASQLNAQAFTVGQDVFFGSGRYEPQTSQGKWLLAHELTHTVQQSPQPLTAIQSVQKNPISLTQTSPHVQRLGLDDILNWVANKASNIPGFTLVTVILGRNPINDTIVERNATNLIRGVMGLVPGGDLIFKTLQESGILEKAFAWVNGQLQQLGITWDGIKILFQKAWKEVSIFDGFEGAYEKIKNIFNPTIQSVKTFASSVVTQLITFIKDAILKPIGQFAQKLPVYPLLTVILGKDPITGEKVERTANTFIPAILKLIPGGEETYKNLQESKTIEKTFAWLNEEITRLNLSWEVIKGLFNQLLDTLSINDLTSPLKAFDKIKTIFAPSIKRVGEFAIAVGKKVLEFVFEGVLKLGGPLASAVFNGIKKAGNVFSSIVKDPISFAGNLIRAAKKGFEQFAGNILGHLKAGLISWIFGALAGAGLKLPESFDIKGIISLVTQILGLTYATFRGILVDLIGEKPVSRAEKVFKILVTIVTEGLGAAWEQLKEYLSNLKDMVMDGIRDWVVESVVKSAVVRLVTLFNPAGAIIQAILATYNTITFFIEKAKSIAALVESVFASLGNIATGNIGGAASFIEASMARTIPLILGFLAKFLGLGGISETIQKLIGKAQESVKKALVSFGKAIVGKIKSLFGGGKDDKADERTTEQKTADLNKAISEANQLMEEVALPEEIQAKLPAIQSKYKLNSLKLINIGENQYEIEGEINPKTKTPKHPLANEKILSEFQFNGSKITITPEWSILVDGKEVDTYDNHRSKVKGSGLDTHHLLEKRFLKYLNQLREQRGLSNHPTSDTGAINSVVLPGSVNSLKQLVKSKPEAKVLEKSPFFHRWLKKGSTAYSISEQLQSRISGIATKYTDGLIDKKDSKGKIIEPRIFTPGEVFDAHQSLYKSLGKPSWTEAIKIYFIGLFGK